MSAPHGSSGRAGYVTMQCLAGLSGCDDEACVCACHHRSGRPLAAAELGPYTPPMGCRVCTVGQRDHVQHWHLEVGWHGWLEPTREQINQRMRRNRGLPPRKPLDLPREGDMPKEKPLTRDGHRREALRWLAVAEAAYAEMDNRGSFPVRAAAAIAQVHATLAGPVPQRFEMHLGLP